MKNNFFPHLKFPLLIGGFLFISACALEKCSDAPTNIFYDAEHQRSQKPVVDYTLTNQYGLYLAGIHARVERDFESAAQFYSTVLKTDPKNPEILKATYALLAAEGYIEKAVPYAEDALKKGQKDSSLPLFIIAVHQAEQNQFEQALKTLNKADKNESLNVVLLPLLKAWMVVGDNDQKKALAFLESLKKEKDLNTLYSFHKAMILEYFHQNKQAETYYKKMNKDSGGESLRSLQMSSFFYAQTGQKEKALDLLDAYLKNHSSITIEKVKKEILSDKITEPLINTAQKGLAESFFSMASIANENRVIDVSLIFTQFALYLYPDFELAKLLLADLLEKNDQWKKAEDIYQTIPSTSSFYFIAQMRYASNLEDQGKIEKALQKYKDLMKQEPDSLDPILILAETLRRHDQLEEALKYYTMAIEKIETPTSLHWGLFYNRAIVYDDLDQWKKAEEDLLKALALNPNHPAILNYLGYSWIEQNKNIDQAILMIEKAVLFMPTNSNAIDSLGWALYTIKRYDEAVQVLERAVELNPSNDIINDHLGDVYWKIGRKQEAKYQWERALLFYEKDPHIKNADFIKEKIEKGLDQAQAQIKNKDRKSLKTFWQDLKKGFGEIRF